MNLQTLNCKVTQVNMKSQPSLMHKNEVKFTSSPSKVQVTDVPKYFCCEKFSSKFPSAFFTVENRSELSTHEVENIGWFILKFNLLLVSSNQATNAFRISQKFFTMLLLVEKWKFLQGEVLVQKLRPRRLKFLFEVLL